MWIEHQFLLSVWRIGPEIMLLQVPCLLPPILPQPELKPIAILSFSTVLLHVSLGLPLLRGSILSINTLDWHLDRYSVDTRWTLDQQLVDNRPSVDRLICIDRKLVNSWPTTVDWDVNQVLIECELRCWCGLSIARVSTKVSIESTNDTKLGTNVIHLVPNPSIEMH